MTLNIKTIEIDKEKEINTISQFEKYINEKYTGKPTTQETVKEIKEEANQFIQRLINSNIVTQEFGEDLYYMLIGSTTVVAECKLDMQKG